MRAFWDQKARENAFWFIETALDFNHPDADAFWRSGEEVLDDSLRRFDLKLRGDERVLEIGCGIGRISRALARRTGEVVGIDVSEEMIGRGTEALRDMSNVSLHLTAGLDLSEFANDSFDFGYSFVTFQHIPDAAITCNYIAELGRVLRPGGLALFQVSQHPAFHRREFWGRPRIGERVSGLLGRAPKGVLEPEWLGSTVSKADLVAALDRGRLTLEGIDGERTLFCFVLARAQGAPFVSGAGAAALAPRRP